MASSAQAQLAALLRKNPQLRVAEPVTRPPRPGSPATVPGAPSPKAALEAVLQTIQVLALAQGWSGQYTYNPDGPDSGLHVILVRDSVLFAEVALTAEALAPQQQTWVQALQAAGQEVVIWTPADTTTIAARLRRPRTKEVSHGGE